MTKLDVIHEVFRLLPSFDRERDEVIDVGANTGLTAMAMIEHGYTKRVLALEPDPDRHRQLRLNIMRRDMMGSIIPWPIVASDREEKLPSAWAEPLDVLLKSYAIRPRVGLLWLDARGHEVPVLRGAAALLQQRVPIVTASAPPFARAYFTDVAPLGGDWLLLH